MARARHASDYDDRRNRTCTADEVADTLEERGVVMAGAGRRRNGTFGPNHTTTCTSERKIHISIFRHEHEAITAFARWEPELEKVNA